MLSLTAATAVTEDDIAALVFGAPAPADRFEITLYVQPGQTIRHRTITVSAAGVSSGIAFPGGKEFLYQGASPVRVTLVPRGKDITHALTLDSAHRDFTLRLRIETMDSKSLQCALYLCINDGKRTFVEGRFAARALDDLFLQQTVRRTKALTEAIDNADVAQLRALLKEGCDPNANLYRDREESRMTGEFGYDTLLTAAIVSREHDCVTALLDAGADVNLPNSARATPLMIGALIGDLKVIDSLLTHGANVKAFGPGGKTALHFAMEKTDNLPVCKRLVEAGAEIDAADEQGCTPLIEAVLREHLELAQWLVDRHADLNHKDRQGYTALYYGKTDAMRIILLKAGAKR
jgi:ankyrin repeat protein